MGDGIQKYVLIINNDPGRDSLGNVNRAISVLKYEGDFEFFVASPEDPSISVDHFLPASRQNIAKLIEGLRAKTDDDDLLVVYLTGKGGEDRVTSKGFHYNYLLASPLNALDYGRRILVMDIPFHESLLEELANSRTTAVTQASRDQRITSRKFSPFFWNLRVPDQDNNGSVDIRERYEHTLIRDQSLSLSQFFSPQLPLSLSGRTGDTPPFPTTVFEIQKEKDLEEKLGDLRPGQLALVAFSEEGCKSCQRYETQFDGLAQKYQGRYLMIRATGVKSPGINDDHNQHPPVAFIDYWGKATIVNDPHSPEGSLFAASTHNGDSLGNKILEGLRSNEGRIRKKNLKLLQSFYPTELGAEGYFAINNELIKIIQDRKDREEILLALKSILIPEVPWGVRVSYDKKVDLKVRRTAALLNLMYAEIKKEFDSPFLGALRKLKEKDNLLKGNFFKKYNQYLVEKKLWGPKASYTSWKKIISQIPAGNNLLQNNLYDAAESVLIGLCQNSRYGFELEKLLMDPESDPLMKKIIMETFGEISYPYDIPVLPALFQILSDPKQDMELRHHAHQAIGNIFNFVSGKEKIYPPQIKKFAVALNKDPTVLKFAQGYLASPLHSAKVKEVIRQSLEFRKKFFPKHVLPLLEETENSLTEGMASDMVWIETQELVELAPGITFLIPHLIHRIEEGTREQRMMAKMILRRMGIGLLEALPEFQRLMKDPRLEVREDVANIIQRRRHRPRIREALDLRAEEDPKVKDFLDEVAATDRGRRERWKKKLEADPHWNPDGL